MAKRNQWDQLLIDPTIDDPHDHITLNFATGDYSDVTIRGAETIRIFALQRKQLVKGRREAFVRCQVMLCSWHDLYRERKLPRAAEVLTSLRAQPFADVLYAMIRRRDEPGATVVFGPEVVAALRELPSWP